MSVLDEGEQLTCHQWTPSGSLLLGTSRSRVLVVHNASPTALTSATWQDGTEVHKALLLFDAASSRPTAVVEPPVSQQEVLGQRGHVLSIAVMKSKLLTVLAGSGGKAGHAVWLDAKDYKKATAAPLPAANFEAAAVSPDQKSILLVTSAGQIYMADAEHSVAPEEKKVRAG